MAVAGNDADAAAAAAATTEGRRHAAASARLLSYGLPTPTPELTKHLLLDLAKPPPPPQQQRAYRLGEGKLPSFWLGRGQKLTDVDVDDDDTPPASAHNHHHNHVVVDWSSLRRACTEWITNPMNIALLLWLLCVGVSGTMFVLLLLGLLDGAFPAAADRTRWIEINNQVLNALFTLMSLYQHPALCHHAFLLCRWRRHDAAELRDTYCKSGSGDRGDHGGDRGHMAVVVALLHVTVLSQYVLCGLYWCYTAATRPELAEDAFFVLGIAAPVAAAAYTVCSPLGKSAAHDLSVPSPETKTTKPTAGNVVVEPEWAGGMLDCGGGNGDAAATGCLSLSCTFCVFGWNMERLGFGNAWVHAVTFALLCFAPFWIFGVAALHISNLVIGDAVGVAGVLLCACGLLYGGYWRIQMRTRFGLPGSAACCGSSALTDYARWLFCWPCALAQEVRTASMYRVDGELFYSKVAVDDDDRAENRQPLLVVSNDRDVFSVAAETVSMSLPANDHLVVVHDETAAVMAPPPVQVVVVQVEDECSVVVRHEEMMGGSSTSSPSAASTAADEEDDGVSLLESNSSREIMVDDGDRGASSDESWRVQKVKRLINMVTVLSFLILLYTRGIIL